MSDIIQHAKDLLEGADPNPWIVSRRSFGVIDAIGPIERDPTEGLDVDSGSAELAAASLEMAQELAKETWEYAVQVKPTESEEWRLLSFKLPFITHKTTWFSSQAEAEHERQEQVSGQVNSRIVCRRVSPLEVIDE